MYQLPGPAVDHLVTDESEIPSGKGEQKVNWANEQLENEFKVLNHLHGSNTFMKKDIPFHYDFHNWPDTEESHLEIPRGLAKKSFFR